MSMKEMFKDKKCKRCRNPFKANILIKNDDICRTCTRLNDVTFWYPVLFRNKVPTPKTIILYTNVEMEQLAMGETPKGIAEFLNELRGALDKVGYPAFLRTGYSINKHDWEESCFISADSNLLSHVRNLAEHSTIMCIDRFIPCDFWAVREFIETESFFSEFAGKMPITKERRFFIKNGEVLCSHSYWPKEVFENVDKKLVDELNFFSDEDKKTMYRMAKYISNLFTGGWSVDFLKGKNGTWYCTDMSIAESSYHTKHIKKVKKESS